MSDRLQFVQSVQEEYRAKIREQAKEIAALKEEISADERNAQIAFDQIAEMSKKIEEYKACLRFSGKPISHFQADAITEMLDGVRAFCFSREFDSEWVVSVDDCRDYAANLKDANRG